MHPKDAADMANSVDPHQTDLEQSILGLREAPWSSDLSAWLCCGRSQVQVPLGPKDWKTHSVHPAANGYLINFREG